MSDHLSDRIRAVLALDPDAPALEYRGEWTDWATVAQVATEVEQRLLAAGLPRGFAVGVVLRNDPRIVAALLGVLLARGCIVTISAGQGDAGLADDIRRLHVPVVIATDLDWDREGIGDAARGAMGLRLTAHPVGVESALGLTAPARGRSARFRPVSPSRC